jgi:hypothetical protein
VLFENARQATRISLIRSRMRANPRRTMTRAHTQNTREWITAKKRDGKSHELLI